MHDDIRNSKPGDQRYHLRVKCAAGYVIDHIGAFRGRNPGYFSPVSIDGDDSIRE